jgi:hypothetical protein
VGKSILIGLRWLLVLPAGILSVLAISFILRLIFQRLFFHLSLSLEAYMVTLLNAAVFVLVCTLVAPGRNEKKMNIVLVLFALVVSVFIFLNLSGATIFGFGIRFNNGWLNLSMAIIGACIGFIISPNQRQNLNEESIPEVSKREPSPHS